MHRSPAFSQQAFTTYQTTFWEIRSPQTLPVRLTLRKTLPSVIRAAAVHSSSAKKTHRGLEGVLLRGLHAGGRCYGYRNVPAEGGGV